jgi:hypothetical protein
VPPLCGCAPRPSGCSRRRRSCSVARPFGVDAHAALVLAIHLIDLSVDRSLGLGRIALERSFGLSLRRPHLAVELVCLAASQNGSAGAPDRVACALAITEATARRSFWKAGKVRLVEALAGATTEPA